MRRLKVDYDDDITCPITKDYKKSVYCSSFSGKNNIKKCKWFNCFNINRNNYNLYVFCDFKKGD